MRQNPDSKQSPRLPDLDQMMGEAESALQEGLKTLNEVGNQARQILNERPGVVIAAVSIAGFMTGLLLRQRRLISRETEKLSADPMVMFVASAVAGFTMGPRVVQQVKPAPPAHTPHP